VPYYVKVAQGLRLGYYRGAGSGTWVAARYQGAGTYERTSIGSADDNVDADNVEVFDYWQAQDALRKWAAQQRLIEDGQVRGGPYTVADAVRDYIEEIRPEKKPDAVRNAEIVFDAFILPELGDIQVAKLTTDKLVRWRNANAMRPRRLRTKRTASAHTFAEPAVDDDALRKRKATANRILTSLKAALNRAFFAGRVPSDAAWRKVKPFAKVDEAVVRYLQEDEVRRLVNACPQDLRKLVQAALLSGCRYSELTRLKCGDYNPDSATIVIRFAKGKLRHVTLTDEGRDCFEIWTAGSAPTDHVFLRLDGGVWGKSHQSRPLEEASAGARITPHITFHILRHTHGSHLAMKGVPMGVIAAQLGHADTRMTEKHYAHLAPSYVAQTIRANFPTFDIGPSVNVAAGNGQHRLASIRNV
jgi:integrase